MKFIKKLFSRSKKSEKAPNIAETILNLREHEDDLIKKQECLDKKIEQELVIARENAKTNRHVSLKALQRKKKYEGQLQQVFTTFSFPNG